MKLSIIIINYKSEKIIEKCIEHIYYHGDYEIIIIDNENNSNLISKLSKIPKVKIIPNKQNLGFSMANNLAIDSSKAEYILTLNADAFLSKNYLEKCIAFLDHNSRYASVQGKLLLFNEPTLIDSTGNIMTYSRFGFNENHRVSDWDAPAKEVFGVCAAAAVYRKSALSDVKINNEYFDNDFFAYLEDADLDWRLRLKGYKAYFIHDAIAYHIRELSTPKKMRIQQALRNRLLMTIKNDNILSVIVNMILYAPIFIFLPNRLKNIKVIQKMFGKRKIIQSEKKISHKVIQKMFVRTPWSKHLKKILTIQV